MLTWLQSSRFYLDMQNLSPLLTEFSVAMGSAFTYLQHLCAGCRALLTENKLVTDSRLWQDIEELREINKAVWESRMLQDFANVNESDDDD